MDGQHNRLVWCINTRTTPRCFGETKMASNNENGIGHLRALVPWLMMMMMMNIFSLRLFVLEMPYHKKRKTDRPPRELIPEDSMKAAGAAVLDGKPVNAVGVTHMTLEQYVRKSELLQTPYVDRFMPQPKFSQMMKRERCPVIFYVRQSFTTAYLGKQPGPSKKTSQNLF